MTYAQSRSRIAIGLPDPVRQPGFYDGVVMKRGLAWVADMVLIGILSALIVPFTAFTAVFFFPLLIAVVGFLYRWATIAAGSATLGMRLMSIELCSPDGLRLTGREAFLHTLGYTISVIFAPLQLVSVLMMLFTARRQGLSDHILGTAALNKSL